MTISSALRYRLRFVCFAILLVTSVTDLAETQTAQASIASGLLSDDAFDRERALASAELVAPDNVEPLLRSALIRALERAGQVVALRIAAVQRGEDPERFGDPSKFIFRLIPLVGHLRDPKAVDALTAVLIFQPAAVEALADLGEHAVPALVDVVTSRNSRRGQLFGGLTALRFIVEALSVDALTAESRSKIRSVAEVHLARKDPVGAGDLLLAAVDLAIATADPELRRRVEVLASDSQAVTEAGVKDPQQVRQVQQRAAGRLRGEPSPVQRMKPGKGL